MRITKTGDFERAFKKLPQEIKELYLIQEERFKINRFDPRLHTKKVRTLPHVFSFRITRRYRAFFYLQTIEIAIFFDIDHRKDSYR